MRAKYANMPIVDDVDNNGDDVNNDGDDVDNDGDDVDNDDDDVDNDSELSCCMADRRKAVRLISSWDHCQRFSPSQISDVS